MFDSVDAVYRQYGTTNIFLRAGNVAWGTSFDGYSLLVVRHHPAELPDRKHLVSQVTILPQDFNDAFDCPHCGRVAMDKS